MRKKQMSVSEKLREAIARAERGGATQYQIAKRAGMAQAQLSRVASGETCPTLRTAEKIALAVNCQLAVIPMIVK